MHPGKAYALALVKRHQQELAEAIVDQVSVTVPSLGSVDRGARVRTLMTMLQAFEQALTGPSHQPILRIAQEMTDLRRLGGISVRDLVAATHCYLPVARRILVAKAPSPLEGLRAFEMIEGEIMELLVEAVTSLIPDDTRHPEDDEDTVTEAKKDRFSLAPFSDYSDI